MLMGSLQSSQVSDTKEFFIVDNLQHKLLRIIFCTARVVSRVELGKTRIYRHIAECPQEYWMNTWNLKFLNECFFTFCI